MPLLAAQLDAATSRWLGHVRADRLSAVAEGLASGGHRLDARGGPHGNTGLHEACAGGALAVAAFLIGRGAGLDIGNDAGSTPLHLAAGAGHLALVRLLIERGAALDRQDAHLGSPLHHASVHNQAEAALMLACAGANVNCRARGSQGRDTPLALALACRSSRVADVLLAFGASAPGGLPLRTPAVSASPETASAEPESLIALARRAAWRHLRQLPPEQGRHLAAGLPACLRAYLRMGMRSVCPWPWG